MTDILVDVQHLLHRVKNVTSGDAAMKAGMGLHILFNSIKKAWKDFDGKHVVFCLDAKSWRKEFFGKYKAHRHIGIVKTPQQQEEDEYFFEAVNDLITFLKERTNSTILQNRGVEADDWIARWIQNHPDRQHCIISSDSDFYQLVSKNVFIYDGVKKLTIYLDKIIDEKGDQRNFKIANSKIKLQEEMDDFVDENWPEYCLFFKCIRGDASDGIHSAFPGVREKGTKNKPGIREAFDNRREKGYGWNNLMLNEWEKVDDVDESGAASKRKVRVLDEYEFNRKLIDLTQQPDDIKELMDRIIIDEVQKPRKHSVGMFFMRFCEEYDLQMIKKYASQYAEFLNASYA